ncbi:uncharacterized protein LOC129919444 [Episyrphus balteatus]|uniref:uncharacterized protein LOC129919444 n=1 Tax=Episyrphus balteatus TaxID=286459 RepID=UPI0024855548|nr:uncharacterized protein LOC129919444 [Episyrphus balteatus]
MSDKLSDKESQLCKTIRQHFQSQGVLDDIKCQLQHRLVEMMRGNGDKADCHERRQKPNGDDDENNKEQDTRTILVNQLIMEYLHWHQFNYSAEMFAMETQMESCNPNRKLLEAALGQFSEKEIPILLEIVLNLWKEAQEGTTAA